MGFVDEDSTIYLQVATIFQSEISMKVLTANKIEVLKNGEQSMKLCPSSCSVILYFTSSSSYLHILVINC